MLFDLFAFICIIASIILFFVVITKGSMESHGIEYHFPNAYAVMYAIYLKVTRILFPFLNAFILVGGVVTLSQEIYGLWVAIVMFVTFVIIKGRYQNKKVEDVSPTGNVWLDVLFLPVWLAFFFGTVGLPLWIIAGLSS